MAYPKTVTILEELKARAFIDTFEQRRRGGEDEWTPKYTEWRVSSPYFHDVRHEIYGNQAEMYFVCKSPVDFQNVLQAFRDMGVKVNTNWGGPNSFCVRVAYFKGWHWWE